jgi:hypothetical protein
MADFPMIFRVRCSVGGRAAGKAFWRVVFSDVPASPEIVGNTLLISHFWPKASRLHVGP